MLTDGKLATTQRLVQLISRIAIGDEWQRRKSFQGTVWEAGWARCRQVWPR